MPVERPKTFEDEQALNATQLYKQEVPKTFEDEQADLWNYFTGRPAYQAPQEVCEDDFWQKVSNFTDDAGREVIEKALRLYYLAKSDDTPVKAKAIIVGALAYFIMPVDAIPDLMLGFGFTDDLGVMVAALAAVQENMTQDIKAMATQKVAEWFGEKQNK